MMQKSGLIQECSPCCYVIPVALPILGGHGNGLGGYMDLSKNRGIPKWMVKIMENPIKNG